MEINNNAYGGFVVSKNILAGLPVRYSFREQSSIQQLNGWTLLSIDDDQSYVDNADNFVILSATTLFDYAPVMLEIFDAPYGTDICWIYENGVHIGFYDLITEQDTDIKTILKQ